MKYKIDELLLPIILNSGDSLNLTYTNMSGTELIHREAVTETRHYTHWAFCDFGKADAIFLGGVDLEQFLLDSFPQIQKVEIDEALFA